MSRRKRAGIVMSGSPITVPDCCGQSMNPLRVIGQMGPAFYSCQICGDLVEAYRYDRNNNLLPRCDPKDITKLDGAGIFYG